MPPPARSHDRRLIKLDQGPLRQKAASECGRVMQKLEKARREWQRFEREDRPAFARWMAATFGAILTRLRELESQALEKETLVSIIETEIMFTGESPRRVYQRIMKSRENPQPPNETREGPERSERPRWDEPDSKESETVGENGQRQMFEEVLRVMMGLEPEDLDTAEYDRLFTDFKRKVFEDSGGGDTPFSARTREAEPPRDIRVKELYRVLVRRLHPDSRADNDASVSALWHEVQEAYQAGNVERLETLVALTDLQSNQTGRHTTLFQLRAALAELNRSLRALQKSLRTARQEHAWNFARLSDYSQLRQRVQGELESSQVELEGRVQRLDRVLNLWSTPPASRKRKSRRSHWAQEDLFF